LGAVTLSVCATLLLLRGAGEIRSQRLSDGSVLILSQVAYGTTNLVLHGNAIERLLGDLIPSTGIHVLGHSLHRPQRRSYSYEGKPILVLEFQMDTANPSRNLFGSGANQPEYLCCVSDGTGQEFTQSGFGLGNLRPVLITAFPRDSKWLNVSIKRLTHSSDPIKMAAFRIRNPAPLLKQPWPAQVSPICIASNGMDFALAEATVEERTPTIGNEYSHRTYLPLRVRENGVVLTNWSPVSVQAQDASGNHSHLSPMWLVLQTYIRTNWHYPGVLPDPPQEWSVHWSWEALDTRFVWRLETDFAPLPAAPIEDKLEFVVPNPSSPFTTNIAGVPVQIRSWQILSGQVMQELNLEAQISNNRTDLRIAILDLRDGNGDRVGFGLYPGQTQTRLITMPQSPGTPLPWPLHATIAVVPNIHVTFFVQPRLVRRENAPR
jgi:hypothetical protein